METLKFVFFVQHSNIWTDLEGSKPQKVVQFSIPSSLHLGSCEIRFAISEVQAADPTPNLEVQNCGVVLEVQDTFRQRKCLKLDAHFQGKTVQSFYSMRQKERQ